MKLSEDDGAEEERERMGRGRGRGESASGPAYANPPRAASKSGRQAATAEEWAAFSHREKRCEGGKREWGNEQQRGRSTGERNERVREKLKGMYNSSATKRAWYSWYHIFEPSPE